MKQILYMIGLLLIFWGCSDEDNDVKATEEMPDWLEIKDKPGAFNQLCYAIYKDNQVSLLINDTLGQRYYGEDANGNPVIHTEIFDLSYNIYGTVAEVSKKLPTDPEAMLLAAQTIQKYTIPNLPDDPAYRPRAILLTDSVAEQKNFIQSNRPVKIMATLFSYNNSIRGVVAGRLNELKEMDEIELQFWAGQLAASKSSAWIIDNCVDELNTFYALTGSYYNKPYAYTTSATNVYNKNIQESYGFLRWFVDNQLTDKRRVTPTQAEDVIDYMATVFTFRDDLTAFKKRYGDYEKTNEKYLLMKMMVEKMEKNVNENNNK